MKTKFRPLAVAILAITLSGCAKMFNPPDPYQPKSSCDGLLPIKMEIGPRLWEFQSMIDVEHESLPACDETIVDASFRRAGKVVNRYFPLLAGPRAKACSLQYNGELRYSVDPSDGKVYYGGQNDEGSFVKIAVDGADPETITSKRLISLYSHYAVDKDSVYFRGRKIEGADSHQLRIQSNGFADDGKQAFIGRTPVKKSEVCVLRGELWRTNDKIFYRLEPTAKDAATFEKLGGRYFKDKSGIYCDDGRELVKIDTDPAAFAYVGERGGASVARDARKEFWNCY